MLNVLIDTNILIYLEDAGRILDVRLADIKRIAPKAGIEFKYHPDQKRDIDRDHNEIRKLRILSRLRQYSPVPNPPMWSDEEKKKNQWMPSSDNDCVDDALLCAVDKNAVHFLITEDKQIHRKAIKLGLQDRVYYIESFWAYLQSTFESVSFSIPLGVRSGFLHEFNVKNVFFDSLREAYPGFDSWFEKCARENRKCFYIGSMDSIGALLVQKLEENEVVTMNGKSLPGRSMKLCTFKVAEQYYGRKFGERLLYAAFQNAKEHRVDWLYLTIDGNQQKELETLCEDFGFKCIGIDVKNKRDNVWCKSMMPKIDCENISDIEYAIKYYPNYRKHASAAKWIIPIRPEYHEKLFPDISEINNMFPSFKENPDFYASYSNTIKKAYLSNANVKTIKPGDLVYFYRSHDRQSIECCGIVEKCFRSSDPQEIIAAIAKRSVYDREEIEEIAKQETLVLCFRILEYFKTPITAEVLERQYHVHGPIQTIRKFEGEFR